ncbi:MAG: glycosyltransferase family 4 protein [Actinobacteria bacterium]|nr:glycosyltransferase family 4 protein [Actinomycetota bacterium]
MKVLFVSTLGTAYRGGGNISSSLLAASLRDHGIDVVSEFIRKQEPRTLLDRMLNLVPEGFFNTQTPFLDLLIARRIRQHVREHRPDIVDIQDRFSATAASRYDLGPVAKVFTVIDDLSRTQLEASFRSWKLFLLDLKRRAVLRRLKLEKHIITNSQHTKDVLVEQGVSAENISVFYRSLPPQEWYSHDPGEAGVPARQEDSPVRFLVPGRITREKGVMEIVACITELDREGLGDRFEVLIVGRGPLEKWVVDEKQRRGLKNLAIYGPVPIQEMYEHYRYANAVLMPVLYDEPFGRVALEALLLGKPLLVRPGGGVREIVNGLEGGCIFVTDKHQLQQAMRDIITRPEVLEEMAAYLKRNAGTIKGRFHREILYVEYERYYRDLLLNA